MNNKKIVTFFTLSIISIAILQPLIGENISFKADSMSGTTKNKNESTSLKGNAWIKTEDLEISANNIDLSGEDYQFITASGDVKGINNKAQFSFTCGTLKYNRISEIVVMENNVVLDDTKNNVKAESNYLEYDQNTEIALLQINVKLTQKKSVCTAAMVIYRKNDQIVEMSGSPQIVQDDDTFKAQEISFNLSTEEITLDGRVRGSVSDGKKSKTENTDQPINKTDKQEPQKKEEQIESNDNKDKPDIIDNPSNDDNKKIEDIDGRA